MIRLDKKINTICISYNIFNAWFIIAAVPLYDLFCRVTGFGGTTQNASNKEIPKIIVNQDYKIRFDTIPMEICLGNFILKKYLKIKTWRGPLCKFCRKSNY